VSICGNKDRHLDKTMDGYTARMPTTQDPAERRRWLALYVLCMGVLMIVLDTTIVNVALPSIRADLKFSDAGLSWVVNAYMLTFGGFLLLGGRLGDLLGHRRMFIVGTLLFALTSLLCGLATTRELLIAARAVQGLGGAVVTAVALSLIMDLFTTTADRARAMGVYGFVCSSGGSIGVLLGGVLTRTLNWHWVFLVNLPVGALVCALCLQLVPGERRTHVPARLDVAGAASVTAALMLAVYAIVDANQSGFGSARTLTLLSVAVLLFAAFLTIELRVPAPLVPLRLFRLRNLAAANAVGVLWAAAMFSWFFMSALYMQLVLGYDALRVGLAFLPANLIMAAFSLGLSARVVLRFGIRRPIAIGLTLAAAGLALLARAPVGGTFPADVLPAMVLLGVGAGVAFNPVLLAAMSDVGAHESGLASGIVNTSFLLGGSLGLATLASIAAARTAGALAAGASHPAALAAGFGLAFLIGAAFALAAATLAALLVRSGAAVPTAEAGEAPT
jgi:EmrB/QacA subfamily drug resistance transporter